MISVTSLLRKESIGRKAATLMTGTGAAQLISLASLPFLARLYRPEDFGVLATFLAVCALLTPTLCLKYDLSLSLPRSHLRAWTVLRSIYWVSVLSTLILSALTLFVILPLVKYFFSDSEWEWIVLIPLTSFFQVTNNLIVQWSQRVSLYSAVAWNAILQILSITGISLIFGFWKQWSLGLILGQMLGFGIAAYALIGKSSPRARVLDLFFRPHIDWNLLKAYRSFPLEVYPSHLTTVAQNQIVLMFIAWFFGQAAAGLFSMANRITTVPTTLIASAFGEVFRQEASRLYRSDKSFRGLFKKTLQVAATFSPLIFLPLIALAPTVIPFVLGPQWNEAVVLIQWLAASGLVIFAVSPVDKAALITGHSAYLLQFNLAAILCISTFLGVNYFLGANLMVFTVAWTILRSILYLVDARFQYSFSR